MFTSRTSCKNKKITEISDIFGGREGIISMKWVRIFHYTMDLLSINFVKLKQFFKDQSASTSNYNKLIARLFVKFCMALCTCFLTVR